MLQQFSWQDFLIAALIFFLVWYAAILLLFYRTQLTAFFSGGAKARQPQPLQKEWADELSEDNLLGSPVLPDGVSEVEMNSFSFTPKTPAAETDKENDGDAHRDEQLGLIPDVLEELKSIFNILSSEDGRKSDFISLVQLVKEKYPKIRTADNLEELNRYIRDHVPFSLSEEELEDLWD